MSSVFVSVVFVNVVFLGVVFQGSVFVSGVSSWALFRERCLPEFSVEELRAGNSVFWEP